MIAEKIESIKKSIAAKDKLNAFSDHSDIVQMLCHLLMEGKELAEENKEVSQQIIAIYSKIIQEIEEVYQHLGNFEETYNYSAKYDKIGELMFSLELLNTEASKTTQ
ncbi:hypothetical protein ENBRE01_1113 [Enteropsectra breve]|nr:hypothetical protein ENBRE01_1113 [Enteropsectra breve]